MKHKLTTLLLALLSFSLPALPAQAGETVTYYHLDTLGSPVATTDEQGNLKWREEYRPYGSRIKKQTEADPNSRWYTGHPHDEEFGLTYAGARYYDPVVGRFMGVDPVPFQENVVHSFNRYAYAANNPYKYTDPDGELFTGLHSNMRGTTRRTAIVLGATGTRAAIAGGNAAIEGTSLVAGGLEIKATFRLGKALISTGKGPFQKIATNGIPSKVTDTLAHIKNTGKAPPGYKGGRSFKNDGRGGGQQLPQKDASGNPITYKEHDVNPYQKGVNRGEERLVRGSDGKSYYTKDHYKTFKLVE
jgi:RHS repeat-associated protein